MFEGEMKTALADETTPLIFDAWYVACFASEISTGQILGRRILGIGVALFRDASGMIVAMKDRCPHRAFPLSKSMLVDGEVVCGYHGFRFGPNGRCTKVPSQKHVPPAISVQTYKVRENQGTVWIWMGRSDLADVTPLPTEGIECDPAWRRVRGEMNMAASYVHVHENLIDLTHLSYLHGNSFADGTYAEAGFTVGVDGNRVSVRRTISPTLLPPIFATPLKMTGKDAERDVLSTFIGPALSVTRTRLRSLVDGPDAPQHEIRAFHFITPKDQHTVTYHYEAAVSFGGPDNDVLAFLEQSIRNIFEEDRFGLEAIMEVRTSDPEPAREYSVRSDEAGVRVRRILHAMANAADREKPHSRM